MGHGRQNSMFFSYYYILPYWFMLVNALRAYKNTVTTRNSKQVTKENDGLLAFSFAIARAREYKLEVQGIDLPKEFLGRG